ncbi:MAG: dihydropteroate synthase [Cellvibrionaceae bacterium]
MKILCADLTLDLSQPVVMGILNATPDSFSDGGQYFTNDLNSSSKNIDLALTRVEQMINGGAKIIDVGGESTRPGAKPVSVDEELHRVIPVVEAIRKSFEVIVSVDTSSPKVMEEAAKVGAGIINDVRALQKENALQVAAQTGLPICLMHMQGQPESMQNNPSYDRVVADVKTFLTERIMACEQAGISKDKIFVDPGFGFGKSLAHNLELLKRLNELDSLGCPILVGLSRKSMVAKILELDQALDSRTKHTLGNRSVKENRLIGSVSLALLAAERGASIIRVHDVAATREALQILLAITDNSHH